MVVLPRKDYYGKRRINRVFVAHALPAWSPRLAYMQAMLRLHATFMVNFSSPGNNSLHPSVFYSLR